jgi:hypothetical protein
MHHRYASEAALCHVFFDEAAQVNGFGEFFAARKFVQEYISRVSRKT